ncbi:hypothetical protein AGMMS49982_04270 [Bacteroidia bacterium]|nr:hypothetical protein AGMMS49982_04270 [Bacteroidia bacterium]
MAEQNPQPFLSLVAADLITRYGADLSDVTVVFPNIRAGLFFNNYLYKQAQQPLWAPHYTSIENLFEQASHLQTGDSIRLISLLYDVYIQVFNKYASEPSAETIDEFFFFGEVLLNDFDDIDKNLVNARALFSNLQDLDALRDDFTHLSDNQREALMRRFQQFFVGDTALKTAFRNIWNILGEVYTDFKQKLVAENTAYPGMLMRDVIENDRHCGLDPQSPDNELHYVFVGFNVLSKCEERLFKHLKPQSAFYWDYDKYYLDTEAGRFIKQNIQKFGSALDKSDFDTFTHSEKKITFLASPSDSAQAAAISPWIDTLQQPPTFTQPNSAIVLCNEKLLPTVMHAIPPAKVENVNITMGFPITQTAICSFLQVVTEMQTKGYRAGDQSFYYKFVLPVLRHPYTQLIFPEAAEMEKTIIRDKQFFINSQGIAGQARNDNAATGGEAASCHCGLDPQSPAIFAPLPDTLALAAYLLELIQAIGKKHEKTSSEVEVYTGLHQESIFRAFQVVNRLYATLTADKKKMKKETFLRLLRKLLATVQIPFHGEPVKGLQIMGVLETRTLDFKNLLMLNVNEGFMPGTTGENTFVPQFLREHFGMSTIDHQDSVYAYYFYRLIQRAAHITLIYSTDKTQTGKSEISRFLLQLLVDQNLKDKIQRFSLQAAIKPRQTEAITVEKSPEILTALKNRFDANYPESRPLSPSALNTYIDCSYRFYLQYIKGIKEKEELADELDNSIFGSIFHRAAEYLYSDCHCGLDPQSPETEHELAMGGLRVKSAVTKLTEEEAEQLIAAMENNAIEAPQLELTPENWLAEFGEDGTINTPIGEVKMGENQLAKMLLKNRAAEFGMIKPTLTNPDVIVEKETEAKDGHTERPSSYLFIKTFNTHNKTYHHFESVTVSKSGKEVVISNHIATEKSIKKELLNGTMLYSNRTNPPNSSERYLAENQNGKSDLVPTQGGSVSADKGTTNISKHQISANTNYQIPITGEYLDDFLKNPHKIDDLVLRAFKTEYFNGREVGKEDFNGEQLINFHVISRMLTWLIQFDRLRTPFTINGLELRVAGEFALPERGVTLKIGGIIDRLDEKDGSQYIIDYKTGGNAKEIKAVEDLFEQKAGRATHIFQTFVYASVLLQKQETMLPIVPQLLYIRQAHQEDYSPTIVFGKEKEPITDFRTLQSEFKELLMSKIDDLFNPNIPFTQTEIAKNCEYCSFKELCDR